MIKIKRNKNPMVFTFCCAVIMILSSCTNGHEEGLPKVETTEVTEITKTTAKSGGRILADQDSEISSKGICWGQSENPSLENEFTREESGGDIFESIMTGLLPDHEYHVRAYAISRTGTSFGEDKVFRTLGANGFTQIIADHTIVDRYDEIPDYYLNKVKEMWLVYAGESHSAAIRSGLTMLENLNPVYQVNVIESGMPEPSTDIQLRASRATWGDILNSTGWIYSYGEEDWFTSLTAIARTKAGISHCNTNNLNLAAIGFGWCWDDTYGTLSNQHDPVYGTRWGGVSDGGPEGSRAWGLDPGDFAITGNSVCMDTYLKATQEYVDFCLANNYGTKVFFTTGPVDTYYDSGEIGFQASLKHQYIRDYVKKDPTRILFDYADILCHDNNGVETSVTWNGHTFPRISPDNGTPEQIGHISNTGALRLAKAMWWMLARIAGWDGE